MKTNTRKLVRTAVIAAIYAVVTILFPFGYGSIQIRIAEALTILPFFFSDAILGLFIGCFIANLFSPFGACDIVFGTSATLIAAIITYYIGKSNFKFNRYIAPLPAVIVNAVIVAFEICFTQSQPQAFNLLIKNHGNLASWFHIAFNFSSSKIYFLTTMSTVGIGEVIACFALGLPLLLTIDKNKKLRSYFQ